MKTTRGLYIDRVPVMIEIAGISTIAACTFGSASTDGALSAAGMMFSACLFALAGRLSKPEDRIAYAIAAVCAVAGMGLLVAGVCLESAGAPLGFLAIVSGAMFSAGSVAFGIASGQI